MEIFLCVKPFINTKRGWLEFTIRVYRLDTSKALDKVGEVIGKVYTDDILNQIFSQFCIGK